MLDTPNTLPPTRSIDTEQPAHMFDPRPGEHCLLGCLVARQLDVTDYYRTETLARWLDGDFTGAADAQARAEVALDDMQALLSNFLTLTDAQEDRMPR